MKGIHRERVRDLFRKIRIPAFVVVFGFCLIIQLISGIPVSFSQKTPLVPLQHEVSVVLKLIHVYVTDKKGNPVPDLIKNDFSVTDNGKAVPITDFEKHILKPSPKEAEPAQLEALKFEKPPSTITPSRSTNRKYLFLIDFAYNNPKGITKAKKAALSFLNKHVGQDDEVAVLSYSMIKGLVVHEFLTTDKAKIRKALATISAKDISGRADEIEFRFWSEVEEDMRGKMGQAVFGSDSARQESKTIAETYIIKMKLLAEALRLVPGQKQFILFSTGIPASMIYGMQAGYPHPEDSRKGAIYDPGDSVLRPLSEDMYRAFATAGCTFYVFDTRESSMAIPLFERDMQTFELGLGSSRFTSGGVQADTAYIIQNDRISGLAMLSRLSRMTGGRYYSNIDNAEGNLDQVQKLTGTYYVLGFPLTEPKDGEFHQLKVAVTRKGCEVRAQAGYFNPKPFPEYSELERRLHLYDLVFNQRAIDSVPVDIPVKVLSFCASHESRLSVMARIPEEVTRNLSGKKMEMLAVFFDADWGIADVIRKEIGPGPYRGRDIIFTAGSALKPGDYVCRFVIRDMSTGMSAVGSAKGAVAQNRQVGIRLGTPLLLTQERGCVYVDVEPGKAEAKVNFSDSYPQDRSNFSPILAEVPIAVRSIRAVIPVSVSGMALPELDISVLLVDAASGRGSPLSFSVVDRTRSDRSEVLTLEIPVEGFGPGFYWFYVYARDTLSGSLAHSQTTLTIPKS